MYQYVSPPNYRTTPFTAIYHMCANVKVITIICGHFKPAAEGPKGTKALANEGPFLLFC